MTWEVLTGVIDLGADEGLRDVGRIRSISFRAPA
jgi:hypothetical protein